MFYLRVKGYVFITLFRPAFTAENAAIHHIFGTVGTQTPYREKITIIASVLFTTTVNNVGFLARIQPRACFVWHNRCGQQKKKWHYDKDNE